ncbi:FxsB family cyclophane-forming radical SAM/SPASM peptide maturase [Luteitalea sp.]
MKKLLEPVLLGTPNDALVPFHQYLWKIASRCNLNCSYCYVYNSADSRWAEQPHFMSEATARQTAVRMREHLLAHNKADAMVTFHGGEPLLGGVSHLRMLLGVIGEELVSRGIKVRLSMQSNLMLLDDEICKLLWQHDVHVGTSMDGPPKWNDRIRVTHSGGGSGAQVEQKLRDLLESPYRSLFDGILCVIDLRSDPIEVVDYLMSFEPPGIDFLFPLNNYDRPPAGVSGPPAAPYGEWLSRGFDRWWFAGATRNVRIFQAIMRLCTGQASGVESLGVGAVDLIVVETNGDIEGVDSLKSAFNGATALGLNVHDHDFDTAARHASVRLRQSGVLQLCAECRRCPVRGVCGGGYIPHRYSSLTAFDNPSVYCRDLERIIRHIHGRLEALLQECAGPTDRVQQLC